MNQKAWRIVKVHYCDRANREVTLDVEVVYPTEWMPDQPPHILSHRCSNAVSCQFLDKPGCMWAGTNPGYDPFL